jgi:hypothetical protein
MEKIIIPAFSQEELCEICKTADITEACTNDHLNMSRYREPFTRDLVGKEFSCRFDDGSRLRLRFPEINKVFWSDDGGESFHEEYCEPLKSTAGNVIGVFFFRRAMLPFEGAYLVFDMDSGYATWVQLTLGSHDDEKYALQQPHFGEIEGFGDRRGERHHFATDLVGKAIDWTYNERFTLRHAYVTPSLMIVPDPPREDGSEDFVFHRFCRGFQAKIREGLMMISFTEQGNRAAVLLIDTKQVRDIGCFFGVTFAGKLSGLTITAKGGWGGTGLRMGEGFAKPLADGE